MTLKWDDGHEVVRLFGSCLKGIHHNHKRPAEIVIHPFEIPDMSKSYFSVYVLQELLRSASLVRFGEI